MKRWLYILLISSITGCTHPFEDVPENTPIGNFEALWKIIDQKYCFIEEKDVSWEDIHSKYYNKVKSIEKDNYTALFDTLAEMLNELEDGHVNLYSGFDVSYCKKWYEGYPSNFNEELVSKKYLTNSRMAGGLRYNILADGKIGYIYYESFSNGFTTSNMTYVIKSFEDCQGMIVDVRNNGGGSLDNAYKLAATFFDEDIVVGYWQHKSGAGHNDFSNLEAMTLHTDKMKSKWLRPVIILSNRYSYSATNFFISAMRYAPNSVIIGGRSGGGGGMPLSYELPNGWYVRLSSIRMTDRTKKSIENGINPDLEVTLTSDTKDEIIEKAIEIIENSYKK